MDYLNAILERKRADLKKMGPTYLTNHFIFQKIL